MKQQVKDLNILRQTDALETLVERMSNEHILHQSPINQQQVTQLPQDIPDASSADMAEKHETHAIDWIEILSVLWSSRKLIAYVTGGVTLLSIIVRGLEGT